MWSAGDFESNWQENGLTDCRIRVDAIQSSSGDVSSAVVNVAFENNGGSMQFFSIMVKSITVEVSFSILGIIKKFTIRFYHRPITH
jgi:hypothetical protein